MRKSILMTAVTIAAVVMLTASMAGAAFEAPSGYRNIELQSGKAVIPLADLDAGQVRHFKLGDTGIRFFAYKGEDGVVVTAFDACKLCWAQRRGFSQSGDFMACNSCGKESLITAIADFGHDCSPIVIPHRIDGDAVRIDSQAFLSGAKYF